MERNKNGERTEKEDEKPEEGEWNDRERDIFIVN
jgi:hypothetical protein